MQQSKTFTCAVLAAILLCGSPVVFAEAAESASDLPLQMQLKGYDVKTIHAAANDVMFGSLSLTHTKSEDCNCTTNRADALTGRIEATSADGITFVFRVHYLDADSCGIWIHASQDSEVPADLKMYCRLIYDKTLERLQQKQQDVPEGMDADTMEFTGSYDLSVETMYKVMNETANQVGVGHSIRLRNHFAIEGAFTSGQTQFSYKAYLVDDNKVKFRFWSNSPGKTADGDRYIYETIRTEFQKQLKLAR